MFDKRVISLSDYNVEPTPTAQPSGWGAPPPHANGMPRTRLSGQGLGPLRIPKVRVQLFSCFGPHMGRERGGRWVGERGDELCTGSVATSLGVLPH